MSISQEILRRFVSAAADQLHGTWVIIGGSVLNLLNIAARQTEDADTADCISYLSYAVANNEAFDPSILIKLCEARRKAPAKQKYVDRLISAIKACQFPQE